MYQRGKVWTSRCVLASLSLEETRGRESREPGDEFMDPDEMAVRRDAILPAPDIDGRFSQHHP
jgi:hypothetical protein